MVIALLFSPSISDRLISLNNGQQEAYEINMQQFPGTYQRMTIKSISTKFIIHVTQICRNPALYSSIFPESK